MPADFFKRNRNQLFKLLKPSSVVILYGEDEYPRNGDQLYKYRQNSDLYYLSGIDQEDCALVLTKSSASECVEYLFVKQVDKTQEIWYGKKLDFEGAKTISVIENLAWSSGIQEFLANKLVEFDNIYTLENLYPKFSTEVPYRNLRKAYELKNEMPGKIFEQLYPLTEQLRLIKQPVEIEAIKQAVSITKKAYERVLKNVEPGMKEYQVEAQITFEFLNNGASGHAYEPIVASGVNATILHYIENDKTLVDGDLLLLDFGAEYGNYAADCSRTIPVNGVFSPRQRQCYNAVLDVFKRAKGLYVPGNTIDKINNQVALWMQEKLVELGLITPFEIEHQDPEKPAYTRYFMHGTSHFIGLDVHDVGTKQTILQENMVLTCEPGLYLEGEGIGIRIETDMLVAQNPVDLMQDFPVEIEEIEKWMGR